MSSIFLQSFFFYHFISLYFLFTSYFLFCWCFNIDPFICWESLSSYWTITVETWRHLSYSRNGSSSGTLSQHPQWWRNNKFWHLIWPSDCMWSIKNISQVPRSELFLFFLFSFFSFIDIIVLMIFVFLFFFFFYKRELPEPVIPFKLYDHFITTTADSNNNNNITTTMPVDLHRALSLLPKLNCRLLKRIFLCLKRVHEHAAFNKMHATNLGVIFGPNILRPPSGFLFLSYFIS